MKSLLVCLLSLLVFVQAGTAQQSTVLGQVRLSDGLPVAGAQVMLFDLADLRRGPVTRATTDEDGQFALPLAALGGAFALPQGFTLGANYPNPFNPSTIIPYQLATTSQVRLEVFNVLGQRMATLVNGDQGAGAYSAQWDGTDASGQAAAAGIYIYRLTVDGASQMGRMVLVDGQAGVPMGAGSVAVLPVVEGAGSAYGLVVAGPGLVAYVDAEFGVEMGMGSVDIEVEEWQNVRLKVTSNGILGDVNNNGRVDIDDALLVAMYSVNSSTRMPNNGNIFLGDVNCNGQVDFTDARLIVTYLVNSSDSAVRSLKIGQSGGCSSGGNGGSSSFDLDSSNTGALGITYFNNRFYVVDTWDDKVYAYTSSGQRDAGADFDLDNLNGSARDITYFNNRFYVVDWEDDKVYVYTSSGQRDSGADFDLDNLNGSADAITYFNNRFYVVDEEDRKVYVYTSSGQRDSGADFDLDNFNGAQDGDGIIYFNNRFYVVDWRDDKVYAYTSSGQRDSGADFDLRNDNTEPTGITYFNNRFYVVDQTDKKVYTYTSSG